MFHELGLTPPHGVAFVQWADGSIRIRYNTNDVVKLRETFLNLAKALTEQAVQKLEREREAELERQRMPLSKLETINQELDTLKRAHQELITESTDPVVIIGKVLPDTTD